MPPPTLGQSILEECLELLMLERRQLLGFFNDWKEQVIKEVCADRLLVFEVKQGWEPLCKFLGVPQPEGPFPNTNDTKEQQGRLRTMKTVCFCLWSLTAAAIGTAAYFLKDSIP